ncbi:response regulator transcription factor [Cohnella sp. JJ-181]|uniref:response regulator transcription factor n=1 Tax=Cohnella rhizoplanae TaxID=2974897 RepID=UPI0022FFB8F3|nr:response regulator [Cohnella sp. JJ-181]CAI6084055.1 HTH-type transcriptional activator RhaS [Cohnella sp. JJ-181]
MYSILIVDDERFERDGVKFLIDKYGLALEVAEAASGEEALQYISEHPVDILLTDIRMREMDGLQLAEQVRGLRPSVKIIFLSAYGEFEYAQKAIHLQAIQYILKPVDVTNFLDVLMKAMQMLEEEERTQQSLRQESRKSIQWEKHRILADLLSSGGDAEAVAAGDPRQALLPWNQVLPNGNPSGERRYRMLMLDTRQRFFDSADPEFEQSLTEWLPYPSSIINMNEYQSLILLEVEAEAEEPAEPEERFVQLGRDIMAWFKARSQPSQQEISVIVSETFRDAAGMRDEYRRVEAILESKFFYEEGGVRLTATLAEQPGDTQNIEQTLEEMNGLIERGEFGLVRTRFETLFDHLRNSDQFSVIYVKYICSEIVRAILRSAKAKDPDFFKRSLETIYKTAVLKDLRGVMIAIFEAYGAQLAPASPTPPPESVHKVVADVIQIIEREYRSELSVELIAERVYLTPSYLSHLFVKQTGLSLIKYLTMHRLAKAKALLQETNRKIIDISHDVGYANFPYFCTLFKNYYGKTPTQIREGNLP